MPRNRRSHNAITNRAQYSMEWLRYMAGERPERPKSKEFDLSMQEAEHERNLIWSAIVNLDEPEEPPPNPENYGVSEERGLEISNEIERLLHRARELNL